MGGVLSEALERLKSLAGVMVCWIFLGVEVVHDAILEGVQCSVGA